MIEQAEKYVKKNKIEKGQIWCVYDKDSFPSKDFNAVEEKVVELNKMNSQLQYHAAWSNECIEYWFILHFDNYQSNNHRKSYMDYLNHKFNSLGIERYQKNNSHIFDILHTYGKPYLAIRYAKENIQENNGKPSSQIAPGTKVYELVEELSHYLPETLKEKYMKKHT